MFCCFKGVAAAQAEPVVSSVSVGRSQQQESDRSSARSEHGKAATLTETATTASIDQFVKGNHAGIKGNSATNGALLERTESAAPAQNSRCIWRSLAEELRQATIKQSGASGDGLITGCSEHAELRLPPGGCAISMVDLIQQSKALSDPVALVTFDRASKRGMRSQRISPHLFMDINMEALFAGGVVPPPTLHLSDHSNTTESLDASGMLSPQALLHMLQRVYSNSEAIRLSVHHGNAPLMSLMGCNGPSDYESLLGGLLSTEHTLRAVLHDSCLCMLEGVTASSTQLMVNHPIHGTPSRVVLPITLQPVVVWCRSPSSVVNMAEVPTMAVAVRYNLSAGLQCALQQLHRVYAMLSSLSGIVTLFTLRGKLLHQNTASIRYMGLRQGPPGADSRYITETDPMIDNSGLSKGSILRQIFALCAEQLDDMLEDVVEGKTWKGIVRVPPLLTTTIDPGPAQAAVLAARGTLAMSFTPTESRGQVLSTWERLGPVLMSTQAGIRPSTAQAESDVEGNSEMGNLASTMLMSQAGEKHAANGAFGAVATNTGGTGGMSGTGGGRNGMMGGEDSTGGGGGRAGLAGEGSTADSCIFLAMGSTSGTNCSRMQNLSNLGTQSTSVRIAPPRSMMGRMSSNDIPDANSPLAAALSAPTTPPTVPGPPYLGSKLSGSAPVVPTNPRTQSAIRVAGTSLLRTLMENGATILSDIDNASNKVIKDVVEEQPQNRTGLTEAARRSIVRRRSALKLTVADDNPLSTSTWGLFEGGRARGESKSFTLRRNNAPGTIKRMGTEITLERSFLSNRHTDVASSLPSGGTAAGNPKKRPPSRLMSFLANKNVGAGPPGTVKSMTLANNIWSSSMTDSSLGADGRGCKAISSTTELEIGSRQGSSTNRGLLSFAALDASPPATALASSPRRPPTRRLLRPAIEDVAEAEESGAECSSRLPTCGQQGQLSSVQPGVLQQLTGVANGSTGSQPGRVSGRRPSILGQMQHIRGDNSDRGSASADDEEDCWHEITASTLRDPVSGEQTLLVMQVDVSSRVRAERRIAEVLEAEHKLLESVFPRHVLELAATRHTKDASKRGFGTSKYSLAELPLAQNCASVATYHPMVTILFSDIIGFTSMCHEIPATKVMEFLNNLYSRLDSLLDVYGVYKVETIGDCYMVAGGLMARDADGVMTVRGSGSMDELHAAKVMSFAKAMLRETAEVLLPTTNEPVQMRIGLHSGPVMSGIVGSKMPRFCLFGDTVNTASRMESTCPPGCIQVSSATREFLLDEDWEATGGVMVKGKGKMDTFRWLSIEAESSPQGRTGGQRRPRRASSVACFNTAAHSRDASGSAGTLAQVAAQANGFAATGVPSGPSSCHLSSAALGDAAQANRPNNGCGRAASASIAFAAADGQPLAAFQATGAGGLGSGASGGTTAPNSKRKPHRTCSTMALGYRGAIRL